MTKFISVLILIGAALVIFNRQKIEDWKQSVVEMVNPAAKERRLLGELESNLAQLRATFNEPAIKSGKIIPSDQQKINSFLGSTKNALQELKETNQKLDLGANLSNLLQKIVPLNSKPSPTWLPPGKSCEN